MKVPTHFEFSPQEKLHLQHCYANHSFWNINFSDGYTMEIRNPRNAFSFQQFIPATCVITSFEKMIGVAVPCVRSNRRGIIAYWSGETLYKTDRGCENDNTT